jgi:hypothetical protein
MVSMANALIETLGAIFHVIRDHEFSRMRRRPAIIHNIVNTELKIHGGREPAAMKLPIFHVMR